MRFRTLTLMLAIGLLLAACSSSAATPIAATPTSPPPTSQALASVASSAFHLEKTCSADFSCKVTKSSYAGIPVGTMISYSGPNQGSLSAVVTVSDGTATGQDARTGSEFASGGAEPAALQRLRYFSACAFAVLSSDGGWTEIADRGASLTDVHHPGD